MLMFFISAPVIKITEPKSREVVKVTMGQPMGVRPSN